VAKIYGVTKIHFLAEPLVIIGEKKMTLEMAERWLAREHGENAEVDAINCTSIYDDRDYYILGIVENSNQSA
jgi:hypothetical protein